MLDHMAQDYHIEAVIGASPGIIAVRQQLAGANETPESPLLLVGEHGTGKHLAARIVHFNGARRSRPLVGVTCSGALERALASTLFGHERGAFPDAREQKRGALEAADGGTLMIDEIAAAGPALQAKLLRVLQEGTFTRSGGREEIHVDVRIVAATSRPLPGAGDDGPFSRELRQRLQAVTIALPPLRDRTGDTPLLAHHYVGHFNTELRRHIGGFTDEALALLDAHAWPGNVRELRNAIERAVLVVEGDRIRPVDLAAISTHGSSLFRLPVGGVVLEDVERQLLVQALERARGNQTRTGQLLGLKRDQVRYRMEKFGLVIMSS